MPLTPSQRISLLKVISERLGNESWQFIDVTLKQFGAPTPHPWDGSASDYIVQTVQNAKDQTLIDLAQHLGHKFGHPTSPGVEPPFWRKDMLGLFVSHIAVHRAFAGELQEALLRFGISS